MKPDVCILRRNPKRCPRPGAKFLDGHCLTRRVDDYRLHEVCREVVDRPTCDTTWLPTYKYGHNDHGRLVRLLYYPGTRAWGTEGPECAERACHDWPDDACGYNSEVF